MLLEFCDQLDSLRISGVRGLKLFGHANFLSESSTPEGAFARGNERGKTVVFFVTRSFMREGAFRGGRRTGILSSDFSPLGVAMLQTLICPAVTNKHANREN